MFVSAGRGNEMDEGSQKVQTPSDKISKSWGCYVVHGNYNEYCSVYLEVAQRVKSSHYKRKKIVTKYDDRH